MNKLQKFSLYVLKKFTGNNQFTIQISYEIIKNIKCSTNNFSFDNSEILSFDAIPPNTINPIDLAFDFIYLNFDEFNGNISKNIFIKCIE